MSGVLTRETVIDFVVKGMLEARPLTPSDIRNGFSLLQGTAAQLFGEPVTWEEIKASEARVKEARERAADRPMIHPSFWGEEAEP